MAAAKFSCRTTAANDESTLCLSHQAIKAYSTHDLACNDLFVSSVVLTPDNAGPAKMSRCVIRSHSARMNETIESPAPVRDDDVADASRILDIARTRFDATEGAYAGAVTPPEAWHLYKQGRARLVDVRTAPEVRYVGCVPGALHVEWHGADTEHVERFVHDLKAVVRPDETVLLLCRSGVRSHHAARVARNAGYQSVFNVMEGFEGQRNHAQQRGFVDGWRSHGLPWIQD